MFGYPAAFFHQLLVHDGNLPGGAAKADEAEFQPVPESLPEAGVGGTFGVVKMDPVNSGLGKNYVQIIQHLSTLVEQGVVILDARLQAFQQHLETCGLGRLPAHVQRMDDGADPLQSRVVFQSEARQQGFEGDAMPDVGEARTVEIESFYLIGWIRSPSSRVA